MANTKPSRRPSLAQEISRAIASDDGIAAGQVTCRLVDLAAQLLTLQTPASGDLASDIYRAIRCAWKRNRREVYSENELEDPREQATLRDHMALCDSIRGEAAKEIKRAPINYLPFRMCTDSLEPLRILRGDIVTVASGASVENMDLAALYTPRGLWIALFWIESPDTVCLRTERFDCDDYHYAPEDIRLLGRVVSVSRDGLPVSVGCDLRAEEGGTS